MANLEISLKNVISDLNEVPIKEITGLKTPLENPVSVTQLVQVDEQISKKAVTKIRNNRRNKKFNLEKKKPEIQKSEQFKGRSANKSNERNELYILSTGNETANDKRVIKTRSSTKVNKENQENQTKNINKSKNFSPSHKLTEYFSGLKVHEQIQPTTETVEKKSDKNKKNEISVKENVLKSPLSASEPPLRSSGKNLRSKVKLNFDKTNHKVTEYFQVRRSERKYKWNIVYEEQKNLYNKILDEEEDGLEVVDIEGKGRGIVTTKAFQKGDFVVEYIGELIDKVIADEREKQYAKNKQIGCYMYYFCHRDKKYCIDATKESGKLGRLINHSRKKGNLKSRIIEIKAVPRLIFFAKMDIPIGTELLYDYGDRRRETVENHPWLNS